MILAIFIVRRVIISSIIYQARCSIGTAVSCGKRYFLLFRIISSNTVYISLSIVAQCCDFGDVMIC